MTTTEPITIPIEGEPSDFIADAKKVQAEMDAMTAKLKAAGVSQSAYNKAVANSKTALKETAVATTQATQAVKQSSISITDLRSAYMIAADVARVAGQVWNATGQEFVNYAEQVKNMSRSLGASAEETSRIIQVADDVRISYESLTVAMKTAQKDGVQPNIEGLAKLADQYKAIQSPTERTKFLLDTFGKSGLEMGKLMEKGGDGIRSMSAAIDENMIMTQDGIQASDEYQLALDSLNDSYDATKITIGSYLVGPATDLLNHYRDVTTSLKENGYWYTLTHQFALDDIAAKREEADAAFRAAEGNNEFSDSLDNTAGAIDGQKEAVQGAKDALKDYQDALDAVSQSNKDMESMSRTIAEDQKAYAQDHADAAATLGEAIAKGDKEGIASAKKDIQDLEAQWHESSNNMIYDMVLVGVSAGGLLDSEQKALDEYAVKAGIKTQADIDEANKRREIADSTIAGILQSEDVLTEQKKVDAETLRLQDEITSAESLTASANEAAAIGQVSQMTQAEIHNQMLLANSAKNTAAAYGSIKYSGTSGGAALGGTSFTATKGTTGGRSPDERGHATGGDFLIPMSYGNEGFKLGNGDTASGGETISIGTKGSGNGATYNIVINNPKKEAAEESIRAAMKKLAYTGAVA